MTQPNRKKIGDIEVDDGERRLAQRVIDAFLGIAHEDAARLSGFPVEGPVPLAVNAYLVTFNGKHALIDAGSGTTMGPTLGKVPENLRILGVAPEQIDYVLLTHIHPDHSNGLTNDNGQRPLPQR